MMSYDACWNHSSRELPSETKVLYANFREYNCPFGTVAALAPPQLESEPQRVMDRLLGECLKRKWLTE